MPMTEIETERVSLKREVLPDAIWQMGKLVSLFEKVLLPKTVATRTPSISDIEHRNVNCLEKTFLISVL